MLDSKKEFKRQSQPQGPDASDASDLRSDSAALLPAGARRRSSHGDF